MNAGNTNGGKRAVSKRRGLRGTVYQRGHKWAYMLDLGPDPLSGKRRQQAKTGFSTEQDAWDALAQAQAQLRSGSYIPSSRRTVRQFLDEWLTATESTVKPTTFANYSIYASAYVIPVIGDRNLQDIEPATITALYRHLMTAGRRRPSTNHHMYDWWLTETTAGRPVRPVDLAARAGVTNSAAANAIRRYRAGRTPTAANAGLSARTVTSVHVMLRRAFRDATAWRYIPANPVAAAEPPRVDTGEHRTWTPAQLTTFLELARHDRLYAMWLLLATTGVRRSEVAGMRRDALDSLHSTITITTTRVIAAGKAQASSGKTRRSRRLLALDTATMGALTEHLAIVEQERRSWGLDYQEHGLMFCWPDGRPLYPDTITEQFGKLVDRARLPHIRLHDVRHTYATMALRAGVNPKIVSTRLGHATVAFTLDTYTADVPDLDRAAAEQITGLFLPRPPSGAKLPELP